MDWSGADQVLVWATSLDGAAWEIASGGTLRVITVVAVHRDRVTCGRSTRTTAGAFRVPALSTISRICGGLLHPPHAIIARVPLSLPVRAGKVRRGSRLPAKGGRLIGLPAGDWCLADVNGHSRYHLPHLSLTGPLP
jgi:hypothetical protein